MDQVFVCVPRVVGTGMQHGPSRSAASKLCPEFAIKLYSSDRRRSTLGKPNQAQNSVFKALAERRGRLRLYSCRAAYVPFVPFARSDGLRLDVGFASISVGAASAPSTRKRTFV